MTTLIHLNGPPGIGKSTISALWADRHHGTLNLDIDSLHVLIGGWQDVNNRTHEVLRPVALAMAATHLKGGRDVVLPQYLARPEEIDAFEQVATENGAAFREVVLLDDREEAIGRFHRRADGSEWVEHNRRVVELQGGTVFLGAMYDRLLEIVQARSSAAVVRAETDAIEATYALLAEVVAQ